MSDAIDLKQFVKEEAPPLDAWVEEQEYEYSRTASEVVDYLNAALDYSIVDDAIEEYNAGTDLTGWGDMFEACGIETDSDEASVARTHVTSYFDARSE